MNGIFEAALEFQGFAEDRGWRFCFIGGLAVIRWGEPRMTQDVDATVLCGFGREADFIGPVLDSFEPRLPDARAFALRSRVILVSAGNGAGIDLTLSGVDYEEAMVERASPFDFGPRCSLLTCSAEDLVVLKAFADRDRDWMDVRSILDRQSGQLDEHAVIEWLRPLCDAKEAPWIVERVREMMDAKRSA